MLRLPIDLAVVVYFFTVAIRAVSEPNFVIAGSIALTTLLVVLFCAAWLLLAPIVSIVRGSAAREAFRESLALTRGRFLFCATVVCLAWAAAVVPYLLSAFNFPTLHLGGVSETERMAIANILALPFSLFGALASWAAQALLMRWLQGDRPNREAEGLA